MTLETYNQLPIESPAHNITPDRARGPGYTEICQSSRLLDAARPSDEERAAWEAVRIDTQTAAANPSNGR